MKKPPIARAKTLHLERVPAAEARVVDLLAERDRAIAACHAAGMYYRQIGDELGLSTSAVQVIVQKVKGTPSPSRRVAETR